MENSTIWVKQIKRKFCLIDRLTFPSTSSATAKRKEGMILLPI